MPYVRYNGPGGVEVPGVEGIVVVETGEQVEVSAALRDELVARGDEWSNVKDPGGAKAKAAQKGE